MIQECNEYVVFVACQGGLVSAHCDDPDPIMFSHLKLGLGAA